METTIKQIYSLRNNMLFPVGYMFRANRAIN